MFNTNASLTVFLKKLSDTICFAIMGVGDWSLCIGNLIFLF